ncbi:MAG: hypothetical protein M3Q31_11610 [Actinomycetota bacterium]|nr:hypothetical protein [Actinomycetota bacterium]
MSTLPTEPHALELMRQALQELTAANDPRSVLLEAVVHVWDRNAGLIKGDNIWHVGDLGRWYVAMLALRHDDPPSLAEGLLANDALNLLIKIIEEVDAVIPLADPNVTRSAQPSETEHIRNVAHHLRDDIEQLGRTMHAATAPLIEKDT